MKYEVVISVKGHQSQYFVMAFDEDEAIKTAISRAVQEFNVSSCLMSVTTILEAD